MFDKMKYWKEVRIMNKMKNVLYGATSAVMALTPALAFAQVDKTVTNSAVSGLGGGSITFLLQQLMSWLFGILGFLAIIGFLISGILYLTAAGDEDQAGKAKNAMMYSIIGIVVALLGFVIVSAARNFFSGTSNTF